MDKRFYVVNPKVEDLIDYNSDTNYNGDKVELVGWSCDDGPVTIKDWKFINYKGSTSNYSKRVHLNTITFVNCTFKDVNFAGAVPMNSCNFKKCSFENCILTDHIRWNHFDNCSFDFCIFSGYFHGSSFKKNCTYNNVLLEFYGDDSYFDGIKVNKKGFQSFQNRVASKTIKSRDEILRYFYHNEMLELKRYSIGSKFYFLKSEWNNMPKSKYRIIDGVEYFEDIVKDISIDLKHYKPEFRIIGKYHNLIEECKSEKWIRKQKLDKINNIISC